MISYSSTSTGILIDTALRDSQTLSVMLEKVSGCPTVTLTFATNEESISAWVQLFFGLVAISYTEPSVASAQLQILLSRMNEEVRN